MSYKNNYHRLLSFALILTIVIGMSVFFTQKDHSLINEAKTISSIVIGLGASCMLLGLVWLLQRKPLHENCDLSNAFICEAPNTHPNCRSRVMGGIGGHAGFQWPLNKQKNGLPSSDLPPSYLDTMLISKASGQHPFIIEANKHFRPANCSHTADLGRSGDPQSRCLTPNSIRKAPAATMITIPEDQSIELDTPDHRASPSLSCMTTTTTTSVTVQSHLVELSAITLDQTPLPDYNQATGRNFFGAYKTVLRPH